MYSRLVLLNVGGVDCLLPTAPGLELRDAHDGLLASAAPWPDPPANVIVPANWAAAATMAFGDWCIAPPALPLRLDLVVGAGPAVPVAHSDSDMNTIPVPECGSVPETPPPRFGYDTPFAVPGMPVAPEPDPVLPLAVTISALPATAPGSVLTYTVTLTNIDAYDKSINLAHFCPSYIERLDLPDHPVSIDTTRALNCGPAGQLAGGASATFEMRLAIPSTASAGTAGLVWQLGQRGPAAKTLFQIQP
jgi:hypothetical protein